MGEEVETKPAHYRLSRATWEIIVEEYRRGATVPELSLKWRVSQHALRRRITQHGATKRDWGDKIAREEAEAREASLAARQAQERARVEALFAEAGPEDEASADALSLLAMRASHRAMRQQMWEEAKALAQLAEAYSRIATRQDRSLKRAEITLEDIPLELVKAIALNEDECATGRLAIYGEVDPPQAKKDYWSVRSARESKAREMWVRMLHEDAAQAEKMKDLEAQISQLSASART